MQKSEYLTLLALYYYIVCLIDVQLWICIAAINCYKKSYKRRTCLIFLILNISSILFICTSAVLSYMYVCICRCMYFRLSIDCHLAIYIINSKYICMVNILSTLHRCLTVTGNSQRRRYFRPAQLWILIKTHICA